jgi:hypothetical protein
MRSCQQQDRSQRERYTEKKTQSNAYREGGHAVEQQRRSRLEVAHKHAVQRAIELEAIAAVPVTTFVDQLLGLVELGALRVGQTAQ